MNRKCIRYAKQLLFCNICCWAIFSGILRLHVEDMCNSNSMFKYWCLRIESDESIVEFMDALKISYAIMYILAASASNDDNNIMNEVIICTQTNSGIFLRYLNH